MPTDFGGVCIGFDRANHQLTWAASMVAALEAGKVRASINELLDLN
jgi:hypothetical protein